jgi:ectoine hydroxylase
MMIDETNVRKFEEDGFLVLPGVLTHTDLIDLTAATDSLWTKHLDVGGCATYLHLFGFITKDQAFLRLVDLSGPLSYVVRFLGWNIHLYHSHLDVNPPIATQTLFKYDWHRDGGRMNEDLEGQEPPCLSVKVAYFLTDLSAPDSGNLHVVPGSHRERCQPHLTEHEAPPNAEQVMVGPGSAVVFDRRLWHSRGPNSSGLTRKALFCAYSHRWIRPRDSISVTPETWATLDPVRRQLLGAASGPRGYHVPSDSEVPLRNWPRTRFVDEAPGPFLGELPP